MHDWCGEDFDPLAVDASQISQALRKLATKWTRTARPTAKPTAP
jgi:hypothetical protein